MTHETFYHPAGLKTSSVVLAGYLALHGNEIAGLEPITGRSRRFFVVIRCSASIESHLRAWRENRPVAPLDFAEKIEEVSAMIRDAKFRLVSAQ
jgi:hypothetical protein